MYDDFFTRRVKKDSKEESIERYTRLKKEVTDPASDSSKQEAYEEALLYMRDLVKHFIKKKYSSYIKADPAFYDDLLMASMDAIISYLPGYDSSKGAPSTYFAFAIKNALYTEATKKLGRNSPQDLFIRKVKKTLEDYEKAGKTPSIEDLARELQKTEVQIMDILRLIEISEAPCLDGIKSYQDGILPGDSLYDESYKSPEEAVIEKVSEEELCRFLQKKLSVKEMNIFSTCILGGRPYSRCGVSKSEYQVLIHKIKTMILEDENFRKLLKRD